MENESNVRLETALSGFDKETRLDFVNEFEEFNKELELEDQLKKKPIYESKIEEFLTRGADVQEKALRLKKYRPLIERFRERGLIVPDPEISFSEFVKKYPNHNCIKASSMQQLTQSEYATFRALGNMKVFKDVQGRVIHYQYWDNGLAKNTGEGILVMIKPIDEATTDPREQRTLIDQSILYYKKSRKEIGKLLESYGIIPKEKDQMGNGGGFKINENGSVNENYIM